MNHSRRQILQFAAGVEGRRRVELRGQERDREEIEIAAAQVSLKRRLSSRHWLG